MKTLDDLLSGDQRAQLDDLLEELREDDFVEIGFVIERGRVAWFRVNRMYRTRTGMISEHPARVLAPASKRRRNG